MLRMMPFFNITNNELFEDLFKAECVKERLCQNSTFYNSLLSASNNDMLKQLKCAYSTDSEFNDLLRKDAANLELSVFHINIRSLNRNHGGLLSLLQLIDHDFDVLVLSEIWKYNLQFYNCIFKNYNFYYVEPEGTNIGGVGLYVKKSFMCTELPNLKISSSSSAKVESLWLELTNGNKKYIVAGIYRHPNRKIGDFRTLLEASLESVSKANTPCVIAGDFNIDFGKFSTHDETTDYVNSLLMNNFLPVVCMPTRITSKSATIIDHIYYYEGRNCSKEFKVSSGNLWSDLTDHLPNYFLLSNKESKVKVDRPFIRIHSEKNISKFKERLNTVDWDPIYSCTDMNLGYEYFANKINDCYCNSFKLTRLSRKRSKDKSWMTSGLKCSSHHKNKLYRQWMQTRAADDEDKYKSYRRYYKQLVNEAKTSHFTQLFNTKTNTIKQLWKNLATVASFGKHKSKNNVSKLIVNDQPITDTKTISNLFNNYFCTVGENLQKNIKNNPNDSYKSYMPSPPKDSMYCAPVSAAEICDIIKNMHSNKSPGPDNIGPRLLKSIAPIVVLPLTHLFNLSFTTGIVPDLLKIAKVIPVYKNGERCIVNNYRPISLLSVFDKILENLMHTRLYCYFNSSHMFYNYQFGFRKHHSTGLALIDVVDQIYQHLDNRDKALGIYLDLKKAFDTVDHNILLAKLFHYGVRGTVHDWFRSYLFNRKQFVCLNGVVSDIGNISCGVPQGSNVGPLLFLIYINDIGNSIPGLSVKLFADDTNLFIFSDSIDILKSDATNNVKLIHNWFYVNKLSLNIDKTCYSVFGASEIDKANISLKIGDITLQQVECTKYLGILIDTNLNWQQHIEYIYNKIIKFVGIFYRIRHKLNFEMAKVIYFAFVHSYLLYGIEIYGNTYSKYLHKLIILNNKILRILQHASLSKPVTQLYSTFNTLMLPELHKFQILKFMHKFIHHHDQLPCIFSSYFNRNNMFHLHNTRGRDNLHLELFNSTLGQKSVTYKGTILWNTLPDELKCVKSTRSFTNRLKQFIISSSDH